MKNWQRRYPPPSFGFVYPGEDRFSGISRDLFRAGQYIVLDSGLECSGEVLIGVFEPYLKSNRVDNAVLRAFLHAAFHTELPLEVYKDILERCVAALETDPTQTDIAFVAETLCDHPDVNETHKDLCDKVKLFVDS